MNPITFIKIGTTAAGSIAALAIALAGQPVEPARNAFAGEAWQLPAETPAARPVAAPLQSNCLLCHSMDYVTTQPPLTRPQWTAIVEKMRGKFGAVIPTNQVAGLVDVLLVGAGSGGPPK